MGVLNRVAAILGACGLLWAPMPVCAAEGDFSNAEKLHQLNIMLMVSSLRCRHLGTDFIAEYDNFSHANAKELGSARLTLEASYAGRFGSNAGRYAVDRLSTRIANTYGEGHPILDCAELGEATRALAAQSVPGGLAGAADYLLTADRATSDLVGDY